MRGVTPCESKKQQYSENIEKCRTNARTNQQPVILREQLYVAIVENGFVGCMGVRRADIYSKTTNEKLNMQVFMPFQSFHETASCLDNHRLLKQILECKQILNALKNDGPWSNHCITRTWRDYETALNSFKSICILEAFKRFVGKFSLDDVNRLRIGYKSCPWSTCETALGRPNLPTDYYTRYKQHLLAKDFHHYSKHFPSLEPQSGYYALDKTCTKWIIYSGH